MCVLRVCVCCVCVCLGIFSDFSQGISAWGLAQSGGTVQEHEAKQGRAEAGAGGMTSGERSATFLLIGGQ